MTQRFLCILSRVVLDKTFSINGRKFRIKNPNSFDFFEKDLSYGSDKTTQIKARQLRYISQKNN